MSTLVLYIQYGQCVCMSVLLPCFNNMIQFFLLLNFNSKCPILYIGSSDVGTSNGNAYIAGMSVLCAILIMLVVTIVFGFGLCYVVRKRARQADIVIDRMNGELCLSRKPKLMYSFAHTF